MRGSTKRAFSILISAVFFIAAVGVYAYLVKPAYQEANKKRGEIYMKDSQMKDYNAMIEEIQSLLSAYSNISQAQQTVSLMLPPESSIPQAVYQINALATASGLNLQSLSVKELAITPRTALVNGRGTLRFGARLSGTYESLKNFFQSLETNVRIFNINSVRLEKLGNVPNIFSFNLEIDTYYQSK